MSRQPRQESDRIGIRQCNWKYHGAFIEDLKRISVDAQTWASLKTMLKRAADGTAQDVNWEYPCASSSGIVGELKHDEIGEVRYLDTDSNPVVDQAMIHYRIYFNEPTLCPEELWAMGGGAKSHHPEYVGTDQQTDIELSRLRASQVDPTGCDLYNFPV
ncbi:MAG: hypothetical protein WBB07_23915 [Mycobacterium sp.]